MDVLISAATPFEIQPTLNHLTNHFSLPEKKYYTKNNVRITPLITGPGMPMTLYALTKQMVTHTYDLVINAGIGGAYDRTTSLGTVFQVISERFADLGVEEQNGTFSDLFELGLIEPDEPPFQHGRLVNTKAAGFDFLPKADGLTVNKVHGSARSISAIRKKYQADVESMEGAAVFYVCQQESVSFLELRSISNYVEPRQRENWNISLAVEKLNKALIQILKTLTELDLL